MLKDNYTWKDIAVLQNCLFAAYMGATFTDVLAIMPYPENFPDGAPVCFMERLDYTNEKWLFKVVLKLSKDLLNLTENLASQAQEISVFIMTKALRCAVESGNIEVIWSTCGVTVTVLNDWKPENEKNAFITEAAKELKNICVSVSSKLNH